MKEQKKKLSQTDLILQHLLEKGSITTWEAIEEYGITRLSAKIYDIKKLGYIISDEYIHTKNRYNRPVKFKKYYLKGVK